MKNKLKLLCSALIASAMLITGCGAPSGSGESKPAADAKPAAQADEKKASAADAKKDTKSEKLKVTVTTSFLDDMVKQIAGDYVDISLIIPAGEDPHLYLPKPEDYKKIQSAQLVLYHGLHFEGKMVEILEKTGKAVTAGFPEDKIGHMEEDGHNIVDPHFWFDLGLYQQAVTNAANYLSEKLPADKEKIEANAKAYNAKLAELDSWAKKEIGSIPKESRYLVTPHDAFNYFSRNFDIPVFAPQGVSTDSEVALQDLEKTVNEIVEHKIKAIFAESTTDPTRMKKLQESCKAKGFAVKVVSGEGQELFSDSLAPAGQPGDTFIDMFKHNVELIVKNLK